MRLFVVCLCVGVLVVCVYVRVFAYICLFECLYVYAFVCVRVLVCLCVRVLVR